MIDAYENYYKYNLSADPFRLSPDHRFAFSHPSYAKARAYLEFAIRRGEGFITITGAPGTGKTTLINEIVASVDESDVLLATLSSTQLESRDLLHMVAAAFGLRYGEASKATLLLGLEEFLVRQQRKKRRGVLIVDEAQGLSSGAIEELRLLANLQLDNRLLLQVVLVGQDQLRDLVKAPGMEHLSQRIIVATYLEPLNLPDTVTYIEHRLKKVRWRGDPAITEDALRLIHKFSGGVPRRINLICSRLFLFGGLEGKQELSGEDAQIVIEDLQKESLLPDTAPESPGVDRQQIGDLVLSLPRDATTGNAERAEAAGSSQPAGQAAGAPGGKQKRPVSGAEVEDILSSRAPLRAALGQVFSTLEEAEQADAGSRRRRDARVAAAPGGARQPRATGRDWARAAPAASPVADRPGSASDKPHSRRSAVALVAVAAGLVLAFGLTRFDRSDTQTDGGAVTEQPSASFTMPLNPSAEDAIIRDADEGESPAIQRGDADFRAESDTSMDTGTDEQVMPAPEHEAETGTEPEPEPQSDPEPQNTVASVAGGPDRAVDTPAAQVLPTDNKDPDSLSGQASGTAVQAESRSPENEAAATATAVTRTPQPAPVAAPAVVPRDASAATTASTGSRADRVPAQPSSTAIEAEKARLAEEARARFARQLAQAETQSARGEVAESTPVPRAPVTATRVTAPQPSQPKITPVSPSVPKVAVARPVPPAAQPEAPVDTQARIKAALLQGQWTSRDQPATLLPSDVTLCKDEQASISCWSVPRNVNTRYGEALYKVEATLKGFSAGGNFEILYRTLVKLVASQGSGDSPTEADKGDWQVSEYTTKCQLTQPDRVSCRDEKGVTREYRR